MFKKRRTPAPDPREAELYAWRTARLAEHDEYLRTFPDQHLVEGLRKQFAAVIDARVAEVRAAHLARTPRS
jgi:hypothetical protein